MAYSLPFHRACNKFQIWVQFNLFHLIVTYYDDLITFSVTILHMQVLTKWCEIELIMNYIDIILWY